ncbi:MAG: DeoR/GlpR transcriptional regulator [Ruminococcaceae bacterium]|nr:DeoR/GlpR transcriptional regulator [Oscillospiraceae bacterium]
MLISERQQHILDYLKQHQSASVRVLTETFFASEATIRRDLEELQRTGQIRRVYGGATLVTHGTQQIPLFVRENEHTQEKILLCRRAVSLIRDGSVIFLDASSTVQHMVRMLAEPRDVTVITNGLKIAQMTGDMGIKTFVTGGRLLPESAAFVGPAAEQFVRNVRTDVCFLSCKGLNGQGDLTDTSEEETALRRHILAGAQTRVALMTANKMGKTYLHKLCHTDELDHLITEP